MLAQHVQLLTYLVPIASRLLSCVAMDIIDMSIGDGSGYRTNPIAVLAESLIAKGVSVVVSAGNDGDDVCSSPRLVWPPLTTYREYDSLSYGGAEYPYTFSEDWGKFLNVTGPVTLVLLLKSDGSLSDGCTADSYSSQDVKGKMVLVIGDTKVCESDVRGAAAKAAGAAGILVQTTPYGMSTTKGIPEFPLASIEGRTGRALLAAYKTNPANTIEWSAVKKAFHIESPQGTW